MSIKKLIQNTMIIIALLLLSAIGAALYGGYVARSAALDLTTKAMPAALRYKDTLLAYEQARKYEKEFFVFAGNVERRERYLGEWNKAIGKLNVLLSEGQSNTNKAYTKAEVSQFGSWKDSVEGYSKGFKGLAENVKNGTVPDGITANQENTKNVDFVREFAKQVAAAVDTNTKEVQESANKSLNVLNYAIFAIIALLILVLLMVILLARSVPAKISGVINDYTAWVESMSKGDLKREMVASDYTEFEPLSKGLGRLRTSLSMAMERLRAARSS
jgi:nitrogen fixation/metabolism regulation signal transduction histidine kinase